MKDSGCCLKSGCRCAALEGSSLDSRFQPMCDGFLPDCQEKIGSMSKQASWESVRDKGRAIYEYGGVEIVEEDSEQITAYVMSGIVDGWFPVTDGGPYEVILSKRSWENSGNVGGWVQGFLCECKWGFYHSGRPGAGWQGRFCSHAYAALLASNARAKKDFFGDRTASVSDPFVWFHVEGGNMGREFVGRDISQYMFGEDDPYGWHGTSTKTKDHSDGGFSEIYKANNGDELWEFEWSTYDAGGNLLDMGVARSMDSARELCDSYHVGSVSASSSDDWSRSGSVTWSRYFGNGCSCEVYEADESGADWFFYVHGECVESGIEQTTDAAMEACERFYEDGGWSMFGSKASKAPMHADIMEWIDGLELSDFETTPTRGEDSYELHRNGVDLYITCINYGLWTPKLSWPNDPNIGLMKSDLDFDNPYDALEELVNMVYDAYGRYGSKCASDWRGWHVSPDETHAGAKWFSSSDWVDYYGYAEDTGYWNISMGGSGMILVEGNANGLWSAIAECDAHARKSGYTAGRRLEYDDDAVVVRNPDGVIIYKGIFDYFPYKYDFYDGNTIWKFDGEKYEDMAGYTLEVVASKTAGDSYKVNIYGTDAYLVAEWNDVTLYRADGSSVRFEDAYADSEYKLTGKVMDELWWGGDDEEFDELQENVWNAVNDCFEWEREAYFMWEDEVYSSRRTAAHAGYDWRYDADGYYRLLSEFDDLREGQWIDIDGDWVTRVDTKLMVLSYDFDENSWSISAYDEGSNVDYRLFSEYPPAYFATPSDAIDWANDNINWIGEFRIPKLSSRKTASGWEPYVENVTPELRHDVLDPEEILDIYGAYKDESYRKVDNGMLGVVTHHVGVVDDWWSWDTYAGYYSYGIDCGMCHSKEEGMAMCERSFADPGFTVNASAKSVRVADDWNDVWKCEVGDTIVLTSDFSGELVGTYKVVDRKGMSYRDSDGAYAINDEYLIEDVETGRKHWSSLTFCSIEKVASPCRVSGYPYASYDENSRWTCYEPGFEGEYGIDDMRKMYDETVDKSEYPEFSDWEWDATRSGFMMRTAGGGYVGEQFFFEGVMNEIVDVKYEEYDGVEEPTYKIVDENGDVWFATNTDLETMRYYGASKTASVGYDVDGNELRIGDAVYKADEDAWYEIRDVDKFGIVELHDLNTWDVTRYVDKEELGLYMLNGPSSAVISSVKNVTRSKQAKAIYRIRAHYSDGWEAPLSVQWNGLEDTLQLLNGSYVIYELYAADIFDLEMDIDDIVDAMRSAADDEDITINEHFSELVYKVEDVLNSGRRYAGKSASVKQATRKFTYAEMKELEDEIEGRELHNYDRFKDGGLSYRGGF